MYPISFLFLSVISFVVPTILISIVAYMNGESVVGHTLDWLWVEKCSVEAYIRIHTYMCVSEYVQVLMENGVYRFEIYRDLYIYTHMKIYI